MWPHLFAEESWFTHHDLYLGVRVRFPVHEPGGGGLDNWACFHSVNGMGLLMAHLSMVLGPVQSS